MLLRLFGIIVEEAFGDRLPTMALFLFEVTGLDYSLAFLTFTVLFLLLCWNGMTSAVCPVFKDLPDGLP